MSEFVREVLTVQVGHYANYVGTHCWNFQEGSFVYDNTPTDLNHDLFFQSGLTDKGVETFTPRLLVIDCQGSLGSLTKQGSLYDDEQPLQQHNSATSGTSWSSSCTTTVQQLVCPLTQYQQHLRDQQLLQQHSTDPTEVLDLRGCVRYWSDFLRPHLHRDALMLMPGTWHDQRAGCAGQQPRGAGGAAPLDASTLDASDSASATELLWSYAAGAEAGSSEAVFDDVTDKLRRLAERCNSLQGFEVLCHGHDGMGGVAGVVCELLSDEYASKTTLAVPITPPTVDTLTPAHTELMANTLLTWCQLYEHCTALLPLSLHATPWRTKGQMATLPLYKYQSACHYESSSALAAYIECLNSATRAKRAPISLAQLTHHLTPLNRKLVTGGLQLPAATCLSGAGEQLSGGTPSAADGYLARLTVRRGHNCPAPNSTAPNSSSDLVQQLSDALPTRAPFPSQLFTGLTLPKGVTTVSSASCQATAEQSSTSDLLVRGLMQDCDKLRPSQQARLATYGISEDTWQQAVEYWKDVAYCYGVDKPKQCEEDDESD